MNWIAFTQVIRKHNTKAAEKPEPLYFRYVALALGTKRLFTFLIARYVFTLHNAYINYY